MTVTVDQAFQRLGPLLEGPPPYFVSGTITSFSTTVSMVDNIKLLDSTLGTSGDVLKRGFLRLRTRTSADWRRRIGAYDPATGTVTPTPALASAFTAETYECWSTFDPQEIIDCMNRAAARMRIPEDVEITGIANARQYALSSYTWLTDPSQVIGAYWKNGTVAAQYGYPVPISGTAFSQDQGVLTMNLYSGTFGTSDTLILRAWRSLASFGAVALTTDTFTLNNDPEQLDWLCYETALVLLENPLARRLGPDAQQDRVVLLNDVAAQVRRYRARFMPRREARSIWGVSPSWGPSGQGI